MPTTRINSQTQLSLAWKTPVRSAAIIQISVAAPGTSTIAGVTLVIGDRILLTNQNGDFAAHIDNGIYIFQGSGVALTRAPDYDDAFDAVCGLSVYVEEGDQIRDVFQLVTPNPITIGATATAWRNITASVGDGTITEIKLATNAVDGRVLDQRKETRTGSTSATWALSATPFDDSHLLVHLNGMLLTVTTDYTRSGATITFVLPILLVDVVTAVYFV